MKKIFLPVTLSAGLHSVCSRHPRRPTGVPLLAGLSRSVNLGAESLGRGQTEAVPEADSALRTPDKESQEGSTDAEESWGLSGREALAPASQPPWGLAW